MTYSIDPISATSAFPVAPTSLQPQNATAPDFGRWLDQTIGGVNQDVTNADHAVQLLATGQADSLPDVMISIEKARHSLSLMLQVRDRLVSAYQDILRMQI